MELERCAIESGEKSELPAGSPLTGETRPGGIPSSPLGFRLSARPAPAAISARPPRSSSSDTHLESAIPCSAAGPPGLLHLVTAKARESDWASPAQSEGLLLHLPVANSACPTGLRL